MTKPHNPWEEFLNNCATGDNHFRSSEYQELIDFIDGIQAENAALKEQVAALGIENSHLCVANGELKEQVAQLQESIEELTRKYQKHSGNYYASQDALAKLQSKSAALVVALERIRGDLWLQIESKHGPKFATNYPSILTADAALAAFKG